MNMCWINITVTNICVLIILHWTFDTIQGSRLVTVCEKESVNLTCANDTTIQIQDVQFGPLSSANEEDMKDRETTFNQTNFERLCTDRSHCYLNDKDIFESNEYPYVSRLINITYNCDFEYYGCYEDNAYRLFTGGETGTWQGTKPMSALICRTFCSENGYRPYFGTEAGYACFCGKENEIYKLNGTGYPFYNWRQTKECNSSCRGHEYETCGQNARISIYTSKTAQTNNKIFKVQEVMEQKCKFNSSFKNITMISYQRAKHCEHKRFANSNSYDCDNSICWVKQVLPFAPGYLNSTLPKYVIINYTCIAPENNDNNVSEATNKADKQKYTGVIIGIVSGLTLICGVIIGFCFFNRNRLRKSKEPYIRTNNINNQETVEYENVQRADEVYSTATDTGSENRYSAVFKSKLKGQVEKLEQDNKTFHSPDDVYIDTGEGVYDISNQPRYKSKGEDQAIYSHTTEGIYDSTSTNDHIPNDEENTYDQGFHQPQQNVYGISSND